MSYIPILLSLLHFTYENTQVDDMFANLLTNHNEFYQKINVIFPSIQNGFGNCNKSTCSEGGLNGSYDGSWRPTPVSRCLACCRRPTGVWYFLEHTLKTLYTTTILRVASNLETFTGVYNKKALGYSCSTKNCCCRPEQSCFQSVIPCYNNEIGLFLISLLIMTQIRLETVKNESECASTHPKTLISLYCSFKTQKSRHYCCSKYVVAVNDGLCNVSEFVRW